MNTKLMDFDYEEKVTPITYCSTIIFSSEHSNDNILLYVEGFISPKIILKNFDYNFNNKLGSSFPESTSTHFKILPFSNCDNFRWQNKIINDYFVQNYKNKFSEETLRKFKMK